SQNGSGYTHDESFANACDSTFFWEPNSVCGNTKPSLELFPNPVSNRLTVTFLSGNYGIDIYNTQGKRCYQAFSVADHIKLDISSWPNGIYFLVLNTEAG